MKGKDWLAGPPVSAEGLGFTLRGLGARRMQSDPVRRLGQITLTHAGQWSDLHVTCVC